MAQQTLDSFVTTSSCKPVRAPSGSSATGFTRTTTQQSSAGNPRTKKGDRTVGRVQHGWHRAQKPSKHESSTSLAQRSTGKLERTERAASSSGEMKIEHIRGDLFGCPVTASMAHCVSEDLHMGKGIAVLFKEQFGGVQELKKQGIKTGDVAILEREGRYIYYLVTKKRSFYKPTYEALQSSLSNMREHMISNHITHLCIPRIGCGLDGLQWTKVTKIIQELFKDQTITISVYTL